MLDHLGDLEADFLAFYRIENIYQLDGPRFFRLAWRVSAYGGVMKLRSEFQAEQAETPAGASPSPTPRTGTSHLSGVPVPAGSDVVPLTAFHFQFPGLIEQADSSRPDGAVSV